MKKGVHIYFAGLVQGVGFRYTARSLAVKHDIKGWIMNLPDGRVELFAQAGKERLDDFLKDLRSEFSSYIKNMDVSEDTVCSVLKDFQIRFRPE
ncbi:MAG: acylphosphatase [Candidatus Omnitrophica bacterium]|nr:acylphosphatase [Candidatus Omnitrophota bacterium]